MEPWRTITNGMKIFPILLSIVAACAADIHYAASTADAVVVANMECRLEKPYKRELRPANQAHP